MNLDDKRPIWLQLVDEFVIRIVSGQWQPGQRIPSVRELSTELGVNPNTVQRSLAELDNRQLSLTERTAGRFITNNQTIIEAAAQALMEDVADNYIKQAFNLHLEKTTAIQLLEKRWQIHLEKSAELENLSKIVEPTSGKTDVEEEN